jgi:hypothetical protein
LASCWVNSQRVSWPSPLLSHARTMSEALTWQRGRSRKGAMLESTAGRTRRARCVYVVSVHQHLQPLAQHALVPSEFIHSAVGWQHVAHVRDAFACSSTHSVSAVSGIQCSVHSRGWAESKPRGACCAGQGRGAGR